MQQPEKASSVTQRSDEEIVTPAAQLASSRTLRRLADTVVAEKIVGNYEVQVRAQGSCVASDSAKGTKIELTSVESFLCWLEPLVRAKTGAKWEQASWDKAVAEILQSLRNEELVQRYVSRQWNPWLAQLLAQAQCRSSWEHVVGHVCAGSMCPDQQQRFWEQLGSFNGHPFHPMSKTRRPMTVSEFHRFSPEFGERSCILLANCACPAPLTR